MDRLPARTAQQIWALPYHDRLAYTVQDLRDMLPAWEASIRAQQLAVADEVGLTDDEKRQIGLIP